MSLRKCRQAKRLEFLMGKKKEIVARLVPPESNKGIKRKIGLLEGKASVKFNKEYKITEEELLGL